MKSRQNVIPSVFVVRRCDDVSIADQIDMLRKLGDIESLGSYADRCLLRVPSESKNPRETWRRLRARLESEFDLEPAFVDDCGNTSYPTGTVTVRFEKTPTRDDLNEFERQWGLRVKARNKYVPSQVIFEKTHRTIQQYLPDFIESIQRKTKLVRAAWPETISKYQRNRNSR